MINKIIFYVMCILLMLTIISTTGCTLGSSLLQDAANLGCDIDSAQRRGSFEKVRCK